MVSYCSVSDGVRLNTYSDSIGPVCSPSRGTLNHTGPSSAAIQRRGAVQKHTQSTQGLSIQIEDGSRLTARCREVDDSSSVRTCLWGGCSKVVPRLLVGSSTVLRWLRPLLGTKETAGSGPLCLPRPFSVVRAWVRQQSPAVNGPGTWPQLPINAPDCWLGPTQSGGAGAPRILLCG